jgi:hypothetical protein
MFIAAFVVCAGMITYGDISQCKEMPWPPRIVAAALVFGLLDLFSGVAEELTGVIAIGIAIAAIVNKGFASSCEHAEATSQPSSYQSLQSNPPTLA